MKVAGADFCQMKGKTYVKQIKFSDTNVLTPVLLGIDSLSVRILDLREEH